MIEFKWTSLDAMVQALGKEQVFADARKGYKDRLYRKDRNETERALLAAAKKDPRFRDVVSNAKAGPSIGVKKSA